MIVEFTPLKIEGKGHRAVHIRVIEKPTPKVIEEAPEEVKEEPNDQVPTLSE